jgi:hypothetical protein
MTELETQNDGLRKQVLDLILEGQPDLIENNLLKNKLMFFPVFMSLIMVPK